PRAAGSPTGSGARGDRRGHGGAPEPRHLSLGHLRRSPIRGLLGFQPHRDEGRHVAEMWDWLMWRRERAHAEGRRFLMWVYAKQGELYWLRHYARLYGGQEYDSPSADGGQRQVRMPTLAEVNEFIQ